MFYFSQILIIMGGLGLSCLLTFYQSSTKQKSISASGKLIGTKLNVPGKKEVEIQGNATFNIRKINYDDSIEGTLIYVVSEEDSNKVAMLFNKQVTNLPFTIKSNRILALPGKSNEGLNIFLDFDPRFYEVIIRVDGAKFSFDRFFLKVQKDDSDLFKLLCLWVKRINAGRGGTRDIINQINQLLK